MTDRSSLIAKYACEADAEPITPASAAHTAEYIEELTAELERLARNQGLKRLQLLLGLSREEAKRAAFN